MNHFTIILGKNFHENGTTKLNDFLSFLQCWTKLSQGNFVDKSLDKKTMKFRSSRNLLFLDKTVTLMQCIMFR